jgi:hypothetical protein
VVLSALSGGSDPKLSGDFAGWDYTPTVPVLF